MKPVYDLLSLHHLGIIKEGRRWLKAGVINNDQSKAIVTAHPSFFYHPNLIIRLLLFVATCIALSGATGMLALMFANASESSLKYLTLFYGLGTFFLVDRVFFPFFRHYKSGVSEALLYHSMLFTIGGFVWVFEMKTTPVAIVCLVVFGWSAIRYLDLVSTAGAIASFAYLLFDTLYQAGGWVQNTIPIFFLVAFTPLYFWMRSFRKQPAFDCWRDVLTVTEFILLLIIYAAGNYLVVRELSISLMSLELAPGDDIPLAFVFYALTAIVPLFYLYAGIRAKDILLLRTSLLVLAFAVFTFKYYFSTGHHEITFTIGGAIMILTAVGVMRYLRQPKNGFTREALLPEKWANPNVQAFIVSQTLGGNKAPEVLDQPGGGSSAGGGSTDSF